MGHEDLDRLLHVLAEANGSDIHLKVGSPPRIRVDGELQRLDEPTLVPSVTKEMADSMMSPSIKEQFDDSFEADFAYSLRDVGRFRVNVFRQRGTVAIVMRRVLNSAATFEDLGLPDVVQTLSDEQRGLILVTGPTGSGKTTTLAAMIDHINHTRECHVVTIEDPIEVLHKDDLSSINQREVGFDTVSFARSMRAAMRQDPDVILVGEMRDIETVGAALTAAETGHLVLSTLHTIDATETVNRIVDFFPPHQQGQVRVSLAGSLKGTLCQRLVPRGGEAGRIAAMEVMICNGRIQECIVDPLRTSGIKEIIAEGEYYGMQTFDQHLAHLFEHGTIDLRAAMLAATNPHDLKVMLQQRGLVSAGPVSAVR
jgi:twitching motility protein PilT